MAEKALGLLTCGARGDVVFRTIGIGLFFCWFWAMPQDAAVPLVMNPDISALAFWGTALASMVATFLVFAFLFRRRAWREAFSILNVASVASAVFYAAVVCFPLLSGIASSGGVFAVIASGALSAALFVYWGAFAGQLGPRRAVLCSGAALLVACVMVLLLHQFDMRIAGACFSAMPLVSFLCAKGVRAAPENFAPQIDATVDRGDESMDNVACERKQAGRFLSTVFIQGTAFGLLHFLFSTVAMEKCDDPYCALRFINSLFPAVSVHDFYGVMSAVGLALAGSIVVVGVLFLSLNFRKLIYVVGFPLMALGFLIISFDPGLKLAQAASHASGANFTAGEIVYMTGFYYAIVVTWALCSFLVQRGKENGLSLYLTTGLILTFGQLAGLALGSISNFSSASRADFCSVAVFILLLTSLVIATNDGFWRDWGDARPNEQGGPGLFRASCESIARSKGLTPREKEVFALLARGRSMSVIADILVVSKDTVKTHSRNIYQKLGIHSQQELIDSVESEIELMKNQRIM